MSRIEVVAGIILKDVPEKERQVLIAKRSAHQHQGELWEFPGGKVDVNETHQSALARELKEELDISIIESNFFQRIDFDYSDKKVTLNFYMVLKFSGTEKGVEGQPLKWVDISQLINYEFPKANQSIVESLIGSEYALSSQSL